MKKYKPKTDNNKMEKMVKACNFSLSLMNGLLAAIIII
jgi:hypothetical protein